MIGTPDSASKHNTSRIPLIIQAFLRQNSGQAAYDAAEDILQKSNIVAPFDGIVYVLPVKRGGYVQAGDLLLQVADLSNVLVRAYVDEPDIGRLVPGQKTEVTWDAVPARPMIRRSVTLHADLPSGPSRLTPVKTMS